jgi:hypothetical protein
LRLNLSNVQIVIILPSKNGPPKRMVLATQVQGLGMGLCSSRLMNRILVQTFPRETSSEDRLRRSLVNEVMGMIVGVVGG